jgi:hypothetical protein
MPQEAWYNKSIIEKGTKMNTRFHIKNPDGNDVIMRLAVINYFENGGKITVCKQGRRSKANTSFPPIRGTVSHSGHQSVALRRSGKLYTKKG